MAINPKCDKCSDELEDFGALLFSPPNEKNEVVKSHLCKGCYTKISEELL